MKKAKDISSKHQSPEATFDEIHEQVVFPAYVWAMQSSAKPFDEAQDMPVLLANVNFYSQIDPDVQRAYVSALSKIPFFHSIASSLKVQ